MIISYLSDLHLDFHRDKGKAFLGELRFPETDLLVVAGDICESGHEKLYDALQVFCDNNPHALYVLGNHEYYHSTPRTTEDYIFGLAAKFGNLTVAAQPKLFELNGVKFLAGTMWFPDQLENVKYKKFMGDFEWVDLLEPRIYYDNKDFVKALETKPDIVVSHHLPSPMSTPNIFAKSVINRFFVCNVESKIFKYQPKLWIHGHTHAPKNYYLGCTQIVCNPLGYPTEIRRDWKIETIYVQPPFKLDNSTT